MSKQFSKLIHIATIGKTVGLKGDMKLHLNSDFPEQFVNGASFFINEKESLTLSEVNHDRGLVRIAGCTTPEDTKKFTNAKLYTTLERTRKECHLNDGEFFWFDIEGCDILENDKILGNVVEVDRLNASTYLKVNTDKSLVAKGFAKTFLIPFHEPFLVKTDIDKKIIETNGAMDILEAS